MNRRMMMTGVPPFWIFESGGSALANGQLYNAAWSGKPDFSDGKIIVKARYYNIEGEVTRYDGEGSVFGVDFAKYKKLRAKVSVPYWQDGFKIGIGYGPAGASESSSIETGLWTGGKFFTAKGDYDVEFDISAIKGKCPINLYASGANGSGEAYRAELDVSELWLE